ncbi:MAG: WXG100 family type VII secretion target [Nocardioides sp.]|nr:WXG100 family type VII secretion target [Nocardioides sp.]
MLDSGDIVQLDHARFGASTAALDDRLTEMVARRREVGDAVDHLLRGWRGEAAAAFLGSWEAWRDGADEVIDDLRRDVGSMVVARTDVDGADSRTSHAATLLHGRLG